MIDSKVIDQIGISEQMEHETFGEDALSDPIRRSIGKSIVALGFFSLLGSRSFEALAKGGGMLIDDFSVTDLTSQLGTRWRGISDRVMGGVSQATVTRDTIDGRVCLRLSGEVRLENDGGFIQAALDLARQGSTFDASGYAGLRMIVRGNGEQYSVHLRTPDNLRPWQSYRAKFIAGSNWETVDLPFTSFVPHRLETPLDVTRLRRIGLVAIGRAFWADLAVSELAFYR